VDSSVTQYGVGLGSNQGDRLAQLLAATDHIGALPGVQLTARSHVYETPPAGGPPQGHYYNAAIAIETTMRPGPLLEQLLAIERTLGRVRPDAVRWGPRTIDLDMLWWSGGAVAQDKLVVPHPRLSERAFALVPLLEVLPHAADPMTERPYAMLPLARQTLVRVAPLSCSP